MSQMKEEKERISEVELLAKVSSGDNAAVSRLYRLHYPAVAHYIVSNQGDDDEAAEIYQQSFIILFEKLQEPGFQLQSSAGTFLYAVAKNLWLAKLKERRRFKVNSDELELEAGNDELDFQKILARERDLDNLELSVELMGEPCKSLLRAFYHEAKSMEQIAEMMGYTNADNAKNQKYKCLLRLRRIFEKRVEISR